MGEINKRIESLCNDITIQINKESERIDLVLTTVQSLQERVSELEQTRSTDQNIVSGISTETHERSKNNGQQGIIPRQFYDSEIFVIASGVPVGTILPENLLHKATDILKALGEDVIKGIRINSVQRFRTRLIDRPGLVKINLGPREEKTLVLRNKMNLRHSVEFKDVCT